MPTFGSILTSTKKPPRIVTLSPHHFADTYESKPEVEVAIGLRLVSEHDLDVARAQAATKVVTMFSDDEDAITDETARDEAYNDALVCWAVARATTNPNDVSRPYFDCAEDVLPTALTPQAIRFLWDELVRLQAGSGAITPPASDDEIESLFAMLKSGALTDLDDQQASELRKLLAYVHAVLRAVSVTNR